MALETIIAVTRGHIKALDNGSNVLSFPAPHHQSSFLSLEAKPRASLLVVEQSSASFADTAFAIAGHSGSACKDHFLGLNYFFLEAWGYTTHAVRHGSSKRFSLQSNAICRGTLPPLVRLSDSPPLRAPSSIETGLYSLQGLFVDRYNLFDSLRNLFKPFRRLTMTEYDYSPGAYHAYQQKLAGVGNWAQEVSKHKPVNPFVQPADRESDFYEKSKSGTRSKSSSTANHRKSKSSTSHQRRGYHTDVAASESSSDDDGPDRPPTPTNAPLGYGYAGPYGNPAIPRQGAWPSSAGYVSPQPVQYPQQRPQPPIVISNVSGQPLIPTFNHQTRVWEYREEPGRSSRPPRSSRKSRKRGSSVPPGLGQMLPGVGGFVYPGTSPPTSQSLLSGPYSGSQQAVTMSAMYLPSGHTSPASIQYSLPQSAPAPQSMQAQQQQALQARYQQQQQQQQRQGRAAAPVIPVISGVSLPVMHMQAYGQQQRPMMSPPLTGMTTTYTGYPAGSTSANMGYLSASNASMTSGGAAQPMATVVVDSGKRKEKEKESGSSFFGMLGRKKR
ncbi:hypothetical protein BKA70DRAFT_1433249 [Coprinopsis sp. MPI-PUGE-AT-0042]|nr:hypothetical protein BKA70DRAFT_1433249 [Coprinopsis sp. MPI-PUGE-AT-0042]